MKMGRRSVRARASSWPSCGLLPVALVFVVLLAKSLTPALESALAAVGAPVAVIGIIIAAIVLLPESVAAVRAAARNRLQSSINLSLGSGVASIGLTVPTVAVVSRIIDQPLQLGISPSNSVLMALGVLLAVITYGTGRTNVLAGVVHLTLLAAYLFLTFVPQATSFITAHRSALRSKPMPGASGRATRPSTTGQSSAKPPNGAKTCG